MLRANLVLFPVLLSFVAATAAVPAYGEDQEDNTIRPGIGLGVIKLGMTKDEIVKAAGNIDGSYTLESGTKVDFAEWKETPPKKSPNIRYFYDEKGKTVQINASAPVPATADGISCKSTLAEIREKYKTLQKLEYRRDKTRVDYYDDIKHGIAFEFTRDDNERAPTLYAIIVHKPDALVMPDRLEKSLAMKKARPKH